MGQNGIPWHYNEDIYLLTDTGETLEEKAIKLGRVVHSVSQKHRKLIRTNYTVEKLEYERDFIIEYFHSFTLKDLAEELGVYISYMQLRVQAFRRFGDLGKKDRVDDLSLDKDEYIIDNILSMTVEDMAKEMNVSVERLEIKIKILKKRGMILQSGEARKYKYKRTGNKLPKDCILLDMILEPFTKETIIICQQKYNVIEDYGLFILCERNGIKECFNKIDFFTRG